MTNAPRTNALAARAVLVGLALLALSACSPKYPDCATDAECAAHGEHCVSKMCRPCADDSHCGVNDPCSYCAEGWMCRRAPNCCSSVLDCPTGTYCATPEFGVPGRCVDGCARDADCGPSMICQDGRCVAWCNCTDDLGCGAGARCVDCRCVSSDAGCTPAAVYFDYDEARINATARSSIGFSAACLTQRGAGARLVGHADERGTTVYNDQLALRRAEAVRGELQTLGVSGAIEIQSVGERQPVCTERSEQCWRQNRRVDIVQ